MSALRPYGKPDACWCGQRPVVRYRGLGGIAPPDLYRCPRHLLSRPGRRYKLEMLP